MKTSLLLLGLLAATLARGAGDAGFEAFVSQSNLWATTPEAFLQGENRMRFAWLSDRHDAAHYPGYRNSPEVTLFGRKCWDIGVKFESNRLSEVTVSLFNRGDAGDLEDEKAFRTLLADVDRALQSWAGTTARTLPASRLADSRIERKAWTRNNQTLLELKWSTSENVRNKDAAKPGDPGRLIKFRAEYVQLALRPLGPGSDLSSLVASSVKATSYASGHTIRQNVRKEADGTVFLDNLPMVNQGDKGYCAVATTERILTYYGLEIDQHMLAQLANSSARAGTSPDQMFAVLGQCGTKLGVNVRAHQSFDVRKFIAFVNGYNREAKKAGKSEIQLTNQIDIGAVYRAMDPAVLKRTRCEREKPAMTACFADIQKSIDGGIPLAWSVILGLVAEKPALPQAFGGHMRIIFGYNKAKNEILYTDSWGAGHERKTMPFEDAWMITTGLYSFDPKLM
jgi:hypothetical protein